jgi:hypothetical protein
MPTRNAEASGPNSRGFLLFAIPMDFAIPADYGQPSLTLARTWWSPIRYGRRVRPAHVPLLASFDFFGFTSRLHAEALRWPLLN